MRTPKFILIVLCILAIATSSWPVQACEGQDLGTEVLGENDGWASLSPGTTGGSAAEPDHIYTVTNRQELIAALNDGVYPPPSSTPSATPKIIYIDGTIDANVDDDNNPLSCEDYYRDGYTVESFLTTYDPAVWGRVAPSGPLEAARLTSRNAQQARVRIRVGSNTTLVGLDRHAELRGAWLDLRGTASVPATSIIIRNITFEDTYDCFPEWSPTDGELGSWNALYDSISLRNTEHVWVDHNTFRDHETADETLPQYFGVLYQVHDGLLDITNASDLVTVSWNRFEHHDKVMLIGSSDSASADRGKLRVTIHHNMFEDLGQRTPRVRFGQVHVYNNYYRLDRASSYVYSWGVGIESAIYAENNFFKLGRDITPDRIIGVYKGTAIYAAGTYVQGHHGRGDLVDVLAAYNDANDPDLSGDVGWTPELFVDLQPAWRVPSAVEREAGPFHR